MPLDAETNRRWMTRDKFTPSLKLPGLFNTLFLLYSRGTTLQCNASTTGTRADNYWSCCIEETWIKTRSLIEEQAASQFKEERHLNLLTLTYLHCMVCCHFPLHGYNLSECAFRFLSTQIIRLYTGRDLMVRPRLSSVRLFIFSSFKVKSIKSSIFWVAHLIKLI